MNCKMIGMLSGKWENRNDANRRVYDPNYISPTITTCGGGGQEVKIAEPYIAAMRGREPQVLTPKRTEHGKAVRKAYESGQHEESRHTMQQLEPRNDGVSNTLTTVQKDNLVVEPASVIIGGMQKNQSVRTDGVCPCLTSSMGTGGGYVPMTNCKFRVRKLTPKECWRLMDFTDEDFDKAKAALNRIFYNGRNKSNSQLYKQAGNSIVVACLQAILGQMSREMEEEN